VAVKERATLEQRLNKRMDELKAAAAEKISVEKVCILSSFERCACACICAQNHACKKVFSISDRSTAQAMKQQRLEFENAEMSYRSQIARLEGRQSFYGLMGSS